MNALKTTNSCPNLLFYKEKLFLISLSISLCFSGVILGSSFLLSVNDFLLKTSLREKSRILIGPCCAAADVEAKWCKHSGNPGPEQSIPKISIDLSGGLLQVCGHFLYFPHKFLASLYSFFELSLHFKSWPSRCSSLVEHQSMNQEVRL